MPVTDLFRLIIRLFGLYSLVRWTNSLITYSWSYVATGLEGIALGVGMSALYFALIILLVFKADTIIRWLKLDKGFEGSRLPLEKLSPKSIVQLGTVLIGGYLFVTAIPEVAISAYLYVKASASNQQEIAGAMFNASPWTGQRLAISVLNLLIGVLLVSNADLLAKWLAPKEEQENK